MFLWQGLHPSEHLLGHVPILILPGDSVDSSRWNLFSKKGGDALINLRIYQFRLKSNLLGLFFLPPSYYGGVVVQSAHAQPSLLRWQVVAAAAVNTYRLMFLKNVFTKVQKTNKPNQKYFNTRNRNSSCFLILLGLEILLEFPDDP